MITTFKREWCHVSPNFKWEDTKTWIPDNCPMVWSKSSAVFNGFGQSQFMWKLRTDPRIQSAFKKVYETDSIATSFDGFSVFISNKQKSNKLLHKYQL